MSTPVSYTHLDVYKRQVRAVSCSERPFLSLYSTVYTDWCVLVTLIVQFYSCVFIMALSKPTWTQYKSLTLSLIHIYHEYAPEDLTINEEYYREVLHHIHDQFDARDQSCGQMHHDNAPVHSAHLICLI